MPRYRIIRQPRVPGGRFQLPASVLKEIWAEVDKEAKLFGVSRSFVISTRLAYDYGIEEQPDFRKFKPKRKERS